MLRGPPPPGPERLPCPGLGPWGISPFLGESLFWGKVPSLSLPVTGETTPTSLPLSASDSSPKTSGRTEGDLSPAQQKGRGTGDLARTADPGSQREMLFLPRSSAAGPQHREEASLSSIETEPPRLSASSFLHPPEDKPELARMEGRGHPSLEGTPPDQETLAFCDVNSR